MVADFLLIVRSSIRNLFRRDGATSDQMVRGGVWVFVSYGLQQAINIARSIILARLLTPGDFGLMGLASLAMAALSVFTETGIWPALVQRKVLDEDTKYTAWIIFALRGILLGLLLVIVAPLVARFFAQPQLTALLTVLAGVFVISGCNSLSVILLQRELRFDRITYLNLAVTLVSLVSSVGAAIALRNVWAFVAGELVGATAAMLLSYRIEDFRPKLRFSRSRARELLSYGKYLTGAGIITYLATQGDDAVVGKTLGTEALGFYGVAYRASNLPATSISHVINQVTIPGFSKVQDDIAQLRSMYLKTLRLTALVAVPFTGGMFILAPFFIPVLYGPQWVPAIPAFMVLCFFGLERAIGSVAGPVFLARGKTRLILIIGLSKLLTMAVCIVPLTLRYGILGTSIAVTISAVVVQCGVLLAVSQLTDASIGSIGRQTLKPAVATILMMAVLFAAQQLFSWPVGLASLLVMSGLGVLVYLLIIIPSERELLSQLLRKLMPKPAIQGIEPKE